ncbi:uncharacterized protein LOC129566877 isoform X2 [Sitodiplosis mosellana]|uniref:uncharacterized protein LOC129566877 isoform X2 n=1 Tax=Sitodiplosis mosellana TaxID=263140 RepID=UPI002444D45C|nr:uncharacterized protein LOC129566877 isoform X2 [Sitodiplosis mosellana]
MLKMLSRVSVELVVFVAIITSIVSAASATEDSWLGPEFSVLQKVYDDCLNRDDFTGCLKGRALVALDKAINQDSISVVDGIFMEKQNETDVEKTPEFADARVLNDLTGIDRQLMEKISTFLRTHVLKVDLSEERGGGGFGGSKGGLGGGGIGNKNKLKPKKASRYIIAALLAAIGIAGPLGLKAIAVIAAKALLISKIALTIASIIALKKIYSSDAPRETQVQVFANDHRRIGRPARYRSPITKSTEPYRHYSDYSSRRH